MCEKNLTKRAVLTSLFDWKF